MIRPGPWEKPTFKFAFRLPFLGPYGVKQVAKVVLEKVNRNPKID